MPRVIILDPLAEEGLQRLRSAPGIEYEIRTGLRGGELRAALAEFDGAICRSGVQITADVLAGNRRLRAIVRAGVGTDNIDKDAATRQGIVVMNTPAGNTLSTAEHAMALMLALSRNIAPAYQSLCEGRWERNRYMGSQLAGKTLGIIGLGRIGQAVAARAKAFEMRVLGYDPFLANERAVALGIEPVESVRAMLPLVDYLTVHTPLTDETRNLIDREEIALLKPGARLINCARGGIYNEEALAWGLREGKLAGVALDVFAQEPCTSSPLLGMKGFLATPHLGASTEEAQTQVAVEAVELLVAFLTTGAVRHAVNMSPLDAQQLASLRADLNVSYRLGLFLAQWHEGSPRSCRLMFRGEVASKDTQLLSAALAAGLLEAALEEEVNIVNAAVLLRERGIELVCDASTDMGAFRSLITAELTTDQGVYRAAGTTFGQTMTRLVQLGDYRLDAYLDGILLVFRHRDVPGIIGRLGTIFGTHQVNIAQMTVGRAGSTPGGDAIGVMNLDNLPPPEALREAAAHADIHSLRVIRLPQLGEFPAWLRT
jgi:D-3-phosphoglycerate dehydrogenase